MLNYFLLKTFRVRVLIGLVSKRIRTSHSSGSRRGRCGVVAPALCSRAQKTVGALPCPYGGGISPPNRSMAAHPTSGERQPLVGSRPRRLRLKQSVKKTANQVDGCANPEPSSSPHRNPYAKARVTSKEVWSLSM